MVDGRNIWKNNFSQSLEIAKKAVAALGKDRIIIAPSSSLLHSPIDLDEEDPTEFKGLDQETPAVESLYGKKNEFW